jgi:hypothetical protein
VRVVCDDEESMARRGRRRNSHRPALTLRG